MKILEIMYRTAVGEEKTLNDSISSLHRYFSSREEIRFGLMHEEFHDFVKQFSIETKDKRIGASKMSAPLAAFYAERNLPQQY